MRAGTMLTAVIGLAFSVAAFASQGTGAISGTVTTASDTPQPVARAVVTLTAPELPHSRGTVTDEAGRFRIDGLPVGRFMVKVEKPGFITSMYGAQRPARPGTAVVVRQGEQVTNLVVKLWAGAVLTGAIRDAQGRAAIGIPVRAYRNGGASTQPIPVLTNNGAQTDDRGRFRIFGLEPGAYVLAARPALAESSTRQLTDRGVDALLSMLQRGQRTAFPAIPGEPADVAQTFAATFYPGTTSIDQAQIFTLTAGSERDGLDFTIMSVPVSAVSGTVRLPDGSPAARATVRLTRMPRSTAVSSFTTPALSAMTGEDGSFAVAQVTPGNYRITARYRSTRPGGGIIDPNELSQWATGDIAVGTTDLNSVSLTLGPGAFIQGRLTFDRDGVEQPVPANVNAIAITLEGLSTGAVTGMTALVKPDGSFSVTALTGEPLRLRVLTGALESSWAARSALVPSGADWLDAPLTLDTNTQLAIAMTNRRTELSGLIRTSSGAPMSDLFVIAFSADRRFWGIDTRRTKAVRPAADGAFSIKDLPPGEYFLGALTDVDAGDWLQPGFLEPIAAAAIKVTIAEGGKTVQDLKIGR